MARRVIFADTSVLLNFVCSGQHEYLLKFVRNKTIYVPTAVANEMERKLKKDRFRTGNRPWQYLLDNQLVETLPDNSEALWRHIKSYAGPGYSAQGGLAKNLGEYFAIAHCLVLLEEDPTIRTAIIMDDGEAREIARKRKAATTFGTLEILLQNVRQGHITTRNEAKEIWEKLRRYDVLEPFEHTLLSERKIYKSNIAEQK